MKREGFQAFADHYYGKEIACPKLYVLLLREKVYHILCHQPTIRKTVFWYIFLLIHPSNKSSQQKMHFWREITGHVDVFTSNYIKAWKFSFKNFNFPFLTLYFLSPKAKQVDGESKHCCAWMRRPWRPSFPLLAFALSFFTRYDNLTIIYRFSQG